MFDGSKRQEFDFEVRFQPSLISIIVFSLEFIARNTKVVTNAFYDERRAVRSFSFLLFSWKKSKTERSKQSSQVYQALFQNWFINVFMLRILWHWIPLLNTANYGSSLFFFDLQFPIVTVNLHMKWKNVNQPATRNRSTPKPKQFIKKEINFPFYWGLLHELRFASSQMIIGESWVICHFKVISVVIQTTKKTSNSFSPVSRNTGLKFFYFSF